MLRDDLSLSDLFNSLLSLQTNTVINKLLQTISTTAKMVFWETVAHLSIKYIGPETTYEIFTQLVLFCVRVKQIQIQVQILLGSSSLLTYLMVPSIGSVIISLTSSWIRVRVGCLLLMLVILKLAIGAEIAWNGPFYH